MTLTIVKLHDSVHCDILIRAVSLSTPESIPDDATCLTISNMKYQISGSTRPGGRLNTFEQVSDSTTSCGKDIGASQFPVPLLRCLLLIRICCSQIRVLISNALFSHAYLTMPKTKQIQIQIHASLKQRNRDQYCLKSSGVLEISLLI
jgi:hypothetical protein